MDVKLILTKGGKGSQVVPLRCTETIIGRQRGCDLRIPAPEISRRHCRLVYHEDCLVAEDLGSANGTFLNGAPLNGPELVRPGDVLAIGPVSFRVEYALAAATSRRTRDESALADSGLALDSPAAADVDSHDVAAAPSAGEPAQAEKLTESGEDSVVDVEELAWRAPNNEDIRDILSKLEKE